MHGGIGPTSRFRRSSRRSGSRAEFVATAFNAVGSLLGIRARIAVISSDWYDADGLLTMHDAGFRDGSEFERAWASARSRTGLAEGPEWRTHVAVWAARQCRQIGGDFVELGTGKGWMFCAALAAMDWNQLGKSLWLYDRFLPFKVDPVRGTVSSSEYAPAPYAESVEDSRRAFSGFDRVHFVVGDLPDSLETTQPTSIAFLHIDLNAAIPEVESLRILWSRLSDGAMVLLDDYCYRGYRNQYDAMNALAAQLGFDILSVPTGQGLIIKKPIVTSVLPER